MSNKFSLFFTTVFPIVINRLSLLPNEHANLSCAQVGSDPTFAYSMFPGGKLGFFKPVLSPTMQVVPSRIRLRTLNRGNTSPEGLGGA